jgi:hypothetical protein
VAEVQKAGLVMEATPQMVIVLSSVVVEAVQGEPQIQKKPLKAAQVSMGLGEEAVA